MINDDSSCKIKKKVTFNEFQKKYCEVDWDLFVPIKSKYYESKYSGQLNPFPTSLFSKNEENEFHAGIIRFGNVGYKLTAYGYLRAVILKNQTIRNLRRNEEFLKTLRRINGYDD
jgi:hypothetical protein